MAPYFCGRKFSYKILNLEKPNFQGKIFVNFVKIIINRDMSHEITIIITPRVRHYSYGVWFMQIKLATW